jgi:hypothetical protein
LVLAPGDEMAAARLRQSVDVMAGDLVSEVLVSGAGVLILSPLALIRFEILMPEAWLGHPTILSGAESDRRLKRGIPEIENAPPEMDAED